MKSLNENELNTLNENFKGTNWKNARIEGGYLIATHTGQMWVTKNSLVTGEKTCKIDPIPKLYESEQDFDFDQNAWVEQNMDWIYLH